MNVNVAKVFTYNRKAVTTAASQLEPTGSGTDLRCGVQMLAETGNPATIYIGSSSGVSSGNGFPLTASGSLFLPIDRTDSVWLIADSGTQYLRFIGG